MNLVVEVAGIVFFFSCGYIEKGECGECKREQLTAEVVDPIVSRMFLIQELTYFSDGVAIETSTAT